MTDGFLWGGINIRKFCRMFFRNLWMVIAIMVITYLGLGLADKQTYTSRYTSTAVVAVYPTTSSYRYHTIQTIWDLSSKTEDVSYVFNSDLFQSSLRNQNPSLQDCTIDCVHIASTDLLVLHSTSGSPEYAFKGIRAVLDYYSLFSGDTTGAPEIKTILGPVDPHLETGSSKIHKYRLFLCVFSGLMMSALLLFLYAARKTYKTEHSIRSRYKNIRFYSLPFIKSGSGNENRVLTKANSREPIRKVALEIKQVLRKYNKNSLFVTSFADKESGTSFVSALAKELAEQGEKVILIETESLQYDGHDASDDTEKNTLLDVLQQKCTVKDAMFYREELKVQCIPYGLNSNDEGVSYSIDDIRRVLSECLGNADIVMINGTEWYPSRYAQRWEEAADAVIAFCRQDDADFFKVDKMLNDLQKGNTYFAGCVLFGF